RYLAVSRTLSSLSVARRGSPLQTNCSRRRLVDTASFYHYDCFYCDLRQNSEFAVARSAVFVARICRFVALDIILDSFVRRFKQARRQRSSDRKNLLSEAYNSRG